MAGDLGIARLFLERGAEVNRGQRLRLDEAPPGGLRERPGARRAAARRRRPHRPVRPRRRRDAARPRALLGAPRGRGSPRPRAAQPACRRRARPCRPDRRARRHAGCRCAPRLLPAPRRLPRLDAVGRSPGDPRRSARLGGEERPRRGDRSPGRAGSAGGRGSLSRDAARVGCGQRAHRRRPAPRRARRRSRTSSGPSAGPSHGQGVPALHLAAQAGQEQAVDLLLELGADRAIRDALYDGTAAGWAAHGCRPDLAERLS